MYELLYKYHPITDSLGRNGLRRRGSTTVPTSTGPAANHTDDAKFVIHLRAKVTSKVGKAKSTARREGLASRTVPASTGPAANHTDTDDAKFVIHLLAKVTSKVGKTISTANRTGLASRAGARRKGLAHSRKVRSIFIQSWRAHSPMLVPYSTIYIYRCSNFVICSSFFPLSPLPPQSLSPYYSLSFM